MRLRIAPNEQVTDLRDFLEANEYPPEWSLRDLSMCLMIRVEHDGEVVGWVWVNWIDGLDMVLDYHLCISKDFHGRWLTRETIRDQLKLFELMGANMLVARAPNELMHTVLKRIGFKRYKDVSYWDFEKNEFLKTETPAGGRTGPTETEAGGAS